MELAIQNGESSSNSLDAFRKAMSGVDSFEELVHVCMSHYVEMTLGAVDVSEPISIRFKGSSWGKDTGWSAVTLIDPEDSRKWGRFETLNTSMHRLDDGDGETFDLEWFAKRDKRLRIKVDPYEGVNLAPPGSLTALVMSYLQTGMSMVEIRKESVEIKAGCPFAAVLRLKALVPDTGHQFEEEIAIELEKLGRLVEKRKQASAEAT